MSQQRSGNYAREARPSPRRAEQRKGKQPADFGGTSYVTPTANPGRVSLVSADELHRRHFEALKQSEWVNLEEKSKASQRLFDTKEMHMRHTLVDIQQLTSIIAREADYYSPYKRCDCIITDDYEVLKEQLDKLRKIEYDIKLFLDYDVQIRKLW